MNFSVDFTTASTNTALNAFNSNFILHPALSANAITVQGNHNGAIGSNGTSIGVYNTGQSSSDHTISGVFQMSDISLNGRPGVLALCTNSGTITCYQFYWSGSSWEYNKIVAGSGSILGQSPSLDHPLNTDIAVSLHVQVSGSTVTLNGSVNGVAAGQIVDSSSAILTGYTAFRIGPNSTVKSLNYTEASAFAFGGTVPAQTATVGTSFNLNLSSYFSGGTTPYTYSINSGTLPAGLSLNTSTGIISGTPTTAGTANIVVHAVDSATAAANSNSFTITVNAAASGPSFTGPVPSQSATVGSTFSLSLASYFSGGTTPYAYSVLSGTLPAGLTINSSSGTISGTPTTAGTATIVVKALDAGSLSAQTNSFTITVNTAGTLSFNGTVSNQSASVGTAFSLALASFFSGGSSPYSYSVFSGTLPAGLSLNTTTGTISGTPTTAGTATIVVKALDAASASAQTNSFTITVSSGAPVITQQPTSQTVTAGSPAHFSVTATNATSYQWQVMLVGTTTWLDIPGANSPDYYTPNAS